MEEVFGQGDAAMRVGLYARISTHDQQTLPMQLSAMADYASRRNWEIVREVTDVASGTTLRPRREELVKAARRRELDVIVVWRLDRWGRSVADLVTSLNELQALGVGFVSLTEALDMSSPSGRALAGMLAVFSEFERDILRDRVKAGIAQARKEGRPHGRPPIARKKNEAVRTLAKEGLKPGEVLVVETKGSGHRMIIRHASSKMFEARACPKFSKARSDYSDRLLEFGKPWPRGVGSLQPWGPSEGSSVFWLKPSSEMTRNSTRVIITNAEPELGQKAADLIARAQVLGAFLLMPIYIFGEAISDSDNSSLSDFVVVVMYGGFALLLLGPAARRGRYQPISILALFACMAVAGYCLWKSFAPDHSDELYYRLKDPNGTQEVVELLEDHPSLIDKEVDYWSDETLNQRMETGLTPLHFACHQGNVPLADWLLRQGADPNRMANGKHHPMQMAREAPERSEETQRLLATHGSKCEDPIYLYQLLKSDHEKVLEAMLEHGLRSDALAYEPGVPVSFLRDAAARLESFRCLGVLRRYNTKTAYGVPGFRPSDPLKP